MADNEKPSTPLKDQKGWTGLLKEWWYLPVLALGAFWFFSPAAAPTLEEYVTAAKTKEGGHVRTIPSGNITLDGFAANCHNTPIVYDNNFEDHAAAWPQSNFIIINQKYFAALPKVQKLFTFYHECGHIAGIKGELGADCYGIDQGRKLGWLDQKGLDQLCAYWQPKKGGGVHPPGKQRCEHMRACFIKQG